MTEEVYPLSRMILMEGRAQTIFHFGLFGDIVWLAAPRPPSSLVLCRGAIQ